jgi:hypothetical protein
VAGWRQIKVSSPLGWQWLAGFQSPVWASVTEQCLLGVTETWANSPLEARSLNFAMASAVRYSLPQMLTVSSQPLLRQRQAVQEVTPTSFNQDERLTNRDISFAFMKRLYTAFHAKFSGSRKYDASSWFWQDSSSKPDGSSN